MQFITYRPNVVMVSPGGEHGVIRERETLQTILHQERVPAWLEQQEKDPQQVAL